MAAAGDDEGTGKTPNASATRPKPDPRAEALRANLKRRKVQARARDEAGRDALRPEPSG